MQVFSADCPINLMHVNYVRRMIFMRCYLQRKAVALPFTLWERGGDCMSDYEILSLVLEISILVATVVMLCIKTKNK